MSLAIFNITLVTLLAAAASWWLSGYDRHLQTDGSRADLTRRLVRTGLTLVLVEAGIWCQWYCYKYRDPSTFVLYLALLAGLVILWVGCLTDAAARLFVFLTDPVSREPHDPNRIQRDLDRLAELVRLRQNEAALALCQQLEASHEISESAAHEIYDRLGATKKSAPEVKSLALAKQLQTAGKLSEAEAMLKDLCLSRPRDIEAAFALMRLYLRDLKNPDLAKAVLDRLAKQPHISRQHVEYAENSFAEWSKPLSPSAPPEKPPVPIESITELIRQKHFGTAIEALEKQIEDSPEKFELRMQLIEIHGHYCGNLTQASKMIYQLKATAKFSETQIESALDQLRDWRKAAGK